MILRISAFIILLLSVVFLPLSYFLGLFIISIVFFSKFWEGILIGIFANALYPSPSLFSEIYIGFFILSFAIAIILVEFLKNLIQGRNLLSRFFVGLPAVLFFYFFFSFFS